MEPARTRPACPLARTQLRRTGEGRGRYQANLVTTGARMQATAPTVARGCTVRAFLEEDSEEAQVQIRVS